MTGKKRQTPWIRVAVNIDQHPKIAGLSDRAFRALIVGWCHCQDHLTDGFISDGIAKRIAGKKAVMDELETAGLWDRELSGGGWWCHDYLEHQQSRSDVEAKRDAEAERKAKWRARRDAQTNGDKGSDRDVPSMSHRDRRVTDAF